ncbi:MAG: PEP-CTERM sorting domain-containing protein [Isosphaeraceae bacterium]
MASTTTAAVPEPSSLYLLGFGAVCGCVYVMGNKRRERRTARTEG